MPTVITEPVQEQSEKMKSLLEYFAQMRNRTPEEIAEARAEALATARPARPLPPGKTLADVFVGALPDDCTEEEILKAIEDMD